MYGLSNGGNIFDLRWLLKVKVKPWKLWSRISQKRYEIESVNRSSNTFIPVYNRYIHIQNPHKNSGWSLAGCIGCCNVLSAATKLRRLALCAFMSSRWDPSSQMRNLLSHILVASAPREGSHDTDGSCRMIKRHLPQMKGIDGLVCYRWKAWSQVVCVRIVGLNQESLMLC